MKRFQYHIPPSAISTGIHQTEDKKTKKLRQIHDSTDKLRYTTMQLSIKSKQDFLWPTNVKLQCQTGPIV
jgi:hypothetical protein